MITSTYVGNAPPPGDIPDDDAPPHTKKHFAAAEYLRQDISSDMNTKSAKPTVRAVKEEANKRLMLAYLQLPDGYCPQVAFDETLHDYRDPGHESFMESNDKVLKWLKDLVRCSQGQSAKVFFEQNKTTMANWLQSAQKGEANSPLHKPLPKDDTAERSPEGKGKGKAKTPEKRKKPEPDVPTTPTKKLKVEGTSTPRSGTYRVNDTLKAQANVPDMYGGKCVLTHSTDPIEGAHIVPNSAYCKDEAGPRDDKTYYDLRLPMFKHGLDHLFSRDLAHRVISLLADSQRVGLNIIPLRADVHGSWDTCGFVLKPMPIRPGDGKTKMRVQFLRFNKIDSVFGDSVWDVRTLDRERDLGGISDWHPRFDAKRDIPIRICTGDIYELETDDPENTPLPDWDLFNIMTSLQYLHFSLRGGGAVQSLFRHPPPDVDPDAMYSRQLEKPETSYWGIIAKAAKKNRVITEQDMWKWIVALEDLDEEDLRHAEQEEAAKREWEHYLQHLQEQEEESE
ncbi:hypothetical protein PG985_000824 [Apiospora marii]|uniref:HNH nuclease domain-containing protein n=1 Tax=Apiospora marii TaxID=335849 RepID=A0ABR1RG82_9PEZI